MKITAVIAAGGSGIRMGEKRPKQFLDLNGIKILAWSVKAFSSVQMVDSMVIVCPEGYQDETKEAVGGLSSKPMTMVTGGGTRQESVFKGLKACPTAQWAAVHDAARPLVTPEDIEAVCLMAREVGAAIIASPVADTVKQVDPDGLILKTLDRDHVVLAQTPQVCRRQDLLEAYELAENKGIRATDEASVLEAAGKAVGMVTPSFPNLKVTTAMDLEIARFLAAMKNG